MISKRIKVSEQAGNQTFEAVEQGCSGCQQSCAGRWFAPRAAATGEQGQTLTNAEVAISASGLNRVVVVLFGLPLLLLLGLGSAFQTFGMAATPLLSLAALVIALLLTGAVLIKHGAKLIPLLRVKVYASPGAEQEIS